MADSQRRASFRQSLVDALATPELRRVQLGWTGASVGGWVFFIVLAVYAYNEGGAAAVGVAALARMVPAGLAAPLAGVIVDRRSRRDVLVAITVARSLALAGIAAAVAADAPLAAVLALRAGVTALATAHKPARGAPRSRRTASRRKRSSRRSRSWRRASGPSLATRASVCSPASPPVPPSWKGPWTCWLCWSRSSCSIWATPGWGG